MGLGQFCLELHSSKAKKAAVLASLGTAWEARGEVDAQAWQAEAHRLKSLRDELNVYVERLHRHYPNGLTVHRALGTVVAGDSVPVVDFSWPDFAVHDAALMERLGTAAGTLGVLASAFDADEISRTPLTGIRQTRWTPLWQAELLASVRQVREAATQAQEAYRTLRDITGLPDCVLTAAQRDAIVELARVLPVCAGRNWAFATRAESQGAITELRSALALLNAHRAVMAKLADPWPGSVSAACRSGLRLLEERKALLAGLPTPWPVSVTEQLERGVKLIEGISLAEKQLSVRYDTASAILDPSALEREWQAAEKSIWPISLLTKRRIKAALTQAVIGGGEPNVTHDLPILGRISEMRVEAAGIDLRMLPAEVWSGLRTSVEAAKAALRLQSALTSARAGRIRRSSIWSCGPPWAGGACG